MKFIFRFVPCSLLVTALMLPAAFSQTSSSQTTYNINTLAGR